MSTPEQPSIDVASLQAGLRAARLNDQFDAFQYAFIGRFSNDLWRLDLDNGVRLVVKTPFRDSRPGEQPDTERLFYSHIAPRPELPVPRFVGEFNQALVLEYHDLRAFNFKIGADHAHADAAIDALADWHAAFWNAPPTFSWLPNYADLQTRQTMQANYDLAWDRHGARLLQYVPEFTEIGNALVGRLAESVTAMAQPATLIHGDAHAENVALTSTGALLLDWQDPHIANPGLDLAVFITMSLSEEQRPERERYLVDRHTARLATHGCHWPDPWQDYRLGLLRRVARIVEIASPDFVSLPWVFKRTALAAIEHRVEDLIR